MVVLFMVLERIKHFGRRIDFRDETHHWFKHAPCCVTQLAVYRDWVFGVKTDKKLYITHKIYSNNMWRRMLWPGSVTYITIGHNNRMYGVGTDHAVWMKRNFYGTFVRIAFLCFTFVFFLF